MKIFFTTVLGISLAVHTLGQDQHLVDSLSHLVYTTRDDSIKALAIGALVQEYVYTKPDSCIFYTDLGLDLISNRSIKERFDQSGIIGLFSFEAGMYSQRAVALSEQRNDLFAIRMALKAKEVAENSKRNGLLRLRYIAGNMAEVYQNVGEPAIAIEYLRLVLANDTSWQAQQIWTANLGSCFFDLKEYDSALFFLNKIEPGFLLEKNRPWPFPPLYLGHTWVKKGDYRKAIPYYRSSIEYAEHDHYGYDLCRAYLGIADAFKALGMTDSAILYANRSFQLANQLSLPEQSLNANAFLGNLYESKGIIDSAYKYQKISIALKDTIFNAEKIKGVQNYTFNEKLRQKEMIQEQLAYKNKLRFFGLAGGFVVLLFLIAMLIRNNMHKQKAYALLQNQKQQTDAQKAKAEKTLEELRSTQSQLIQSEKMASLGELTAGIAHEIQNPLNFVNNFSEVNSELIWEMKKEIDSANLSGIRSITADIEKNMEKITSHGKRAGAIVKSMLLHSHETKGQKELTDLNALAEEYLRLCFQGLRVRDKTFTASFRIQLDPAIDKINIIPQDIGRVLLNLYNNAFYAVMARKAKMGEGYDPTVTLTTRKDGDKIELKVSDNGNGIPPKVLDKIFQPFFTTKPAGQGTGLGLSLSYDIIKAHGGEIFVATKEGEGTEFTIQLHI